jgi:acetyl-CoA synthetase
LTMSDGATKPPVVHEAHEVDTFHVPKAFFE